MTGLLIHRNYTPLEIATAAGMYELQLALLKNGADPNGQSRCYDSPLLLAVGNISTIDDIERIKLLTRHGASLGQVIQPKTGILYQRTIFTVAAGHVHDDIAVYLMRQLIQRSSEDARRIFITADVVIAAGFAGNENTINLLHENNFEVVHANPLGITALHAAAQEGHFDCCKLLILLGSQLDPQDLDYPSPLYLAALAGHADVVKLLHQAGADPSRKIRPTRKAWKLLTRCVSRSDFVMFKSFSDLKYCCTAIEAAVWPVFGRQSASDVVAYLLQCGATLPRYAVISTTLFEPSRLSIADHDALFVVLRAGADPNARHSKFTKLKPLHMVLLDAAIVLHNETRKRYIRSASMLLDAGADVTAGDALKAMRLHDWGLFERILARDPHSVAQDFVYENSKEHYQKKLLEEAIQTDNPPFVNCFFSRYPKSYSSGALCSATLQAVLSHGDPALITRLLRNRQLYDTSSADLELETTAIGIASCFGHLRILQQLLAHIPIHHFARLPERLVPNVRVSKLSSHPRREILRLKKSGNKYFWTHTRHRGSVINFALESHVTILQFLLDRGYTFDAISNMMMDNLKGQNSTVSLLYNQRVPVETNESLIRRLDNLIMAGDVDSVKSLLATYHNFKDSWGKTTHSKDCLLLAIETGQLDMVDVLLRYGFDPSSPAAKHRGTTALQVAAIYNRLGIAKRLLDANANVNAAGADYKGRTALEAAGEHGHIDMVAFLLESGAETTGSGRKQYIRAIGFAEREGHHVVVAMLKAWRPWTVEDEAMIKQEDILFEIPGPIDTDSEYSQHYGWETEDEDTHPTKWPSHPKNRAVAGNSETSSDPVTETSQTEKLTNSTRDEDDLQMIGVAASNKTPVLRGAERSDTASWYTADDEDSLIEEEAEYPERTDKDSL